MDSLIRSIYEPNKKLDDLWVEESENRLKAYREGRVMRVEISKYVKLEIEDAIMFY